MTTMKISIETIATALEAAIVDQDKVKTMTLIESLKEAVRTDPVAVKWIVDPGNLAHLHDLLEEHLDVPHKVMRVANRAPNRQRRAYMFVEAIEHGVRRVL